MLLVIRPRVRSRLRVPAIAWIVVAFLAAEGGGPARASVGDSDDDDVVVTTPPRSAKVARPRSKPVAFDAHWLQPFFAGTLARQAAADFRQERWAAAESGFTKAAAKLSPGSDERNAARYLAALAKASQSKWTDAATVFEALFRDYPRLAPYHAYNAARCLLRAGELEAALTWAARVPSGTVPEAESALVRIDAQRSLGHWREVADATASYLSSFPAGPRRIEATFKRAEALEKASEDSQNERSDGDPADVTALYRRVWAEAPLDPWGDRAAERLDAIAAALPVPEAKRVRTRIADEWLTRGMVLFDRNRSPEAEAAFGSALEAPGLTVDIECRARYHLAQSVWKQRQRPRAAPLFDAAEAACKRAENADLHAKALYQGARSWAAAGDRAAATQRYSRVETEHADHSYADDARLRTAELAQDAGDEDGAARILTEIPIRYPHGDLLGEALWRLALSAWRAGRYDVALRWLDENLERIPHEDIWYAEGRALYWKARVLEKQGNREGARKSYERAVREYPLSVYALLGFARLDEGAPRVRARLLHALQNVQRPVPFHFDARPLFGEPGFRRAVELCRMGQGVDARRELAHLGLPTAGERHAASDRRDGDDLLWIAAVLLDRGGVWSASHSIPRYTLTDYTKTYPAGLGATKWRLSYPRAFPELVTSNARANQLPEALQLAIMREESAFSPRIESFANAVGLTQMLIKTARRFSNGQAVTRDALMDPVKNLEYGARFLGFLWGHFGKVAPLAIAGYNAGEGAVDRWLSERGTLALDEFMETIPFDETRNYTKRVLASYFAYSWLYDAKRPIPAVPLRARP